MAKLIKWSKQAVSDRIQILDYLFKRIGNKIYCKKLDKSLKESIRFISEHPLIGPKLDDSEDRYFVKGNYQIFYRIIEDRLELLHIWDCRRNPDDIEL